MQNKYFTETLGMIEPHLVELGEKEVARVGKDGLEPKIIKYYGYFVPFCPTS